MEILTPEQVYDLWAPRDSVWSAWVPPVFFTQVRVPADLGSSGSIETVELDWFDGARAAIILDLADALGVRYAIAFAQRGFRPVPMFNSSPGPTAQGDPYEVANIVQGGMGDAGPSNPSVGRLATLEMGKLIASFAAATPQVGRLVLPPEAPPVFMLDAMRIKGHYAALPGRFDNRWIVFPQDFPSGRFLMQHGIERALLVVNDQLNVVQDDLAHVLLRWQEQGITIWKKSILNHDRPTKLTVHRPSRFRAIWYRAMAMFGFRRNSVGGFGSMIPEESSGGGFG